MWRHATLLSSLVAAAVAVLGAPAPVHACGGFFCNRLPIDQAGENIVFAVEADGTMETHVQILYQGSAESFAWILPVPTLPEIAVGTDALFRQLRESTNPRFVLDHVQTGTCRPTPVCHHLFESTSTSAGGGGSDAPAPRDRGVVEVVAEETVGPYDAVVLSAGDATALLGWLVDNDYDIPEASVPILMEYIDDGSFFLALKLRQERSTGEIQPVVLRYRERTPCVPIKLTSIATVPDIPVTALILGDRHARPVNYSATEPNLDDPELWLGGTEYVDSVTRAVDDAGGQAFVTDYAGDTPTLSLAVEPIDDLRTETDPGRFLMALQERGLEGDGQLRGILLRHVPPPDDADANRFYNCLANDFCTDEHRAYAAALAFDPNALVDDLDAAIVVPRDRAQGLVDRHPQLTRLFTTMSREDMTLDPIFELSAGLPEVGHIHEATYRTECSPDFFAFHAPQMLILPSGREHRAQEGIAYLGSDADYCVDRNRGTYGPHVLPETSRATAAHRALRLGGGGGCSTSDEGSGFGVVLLIGVMVLGARRRGGSVARLRQTCQRTPTSLP